MSSFLHVEGTFAGIAKGLFPDANYAIGYPDELNLAAEDSENLFIGLNMFMVFNRSKADASTEETTVTIEFALRDTFETNSEQQMNILQSCEICANAFLNELDSESLKEYISVTSVRKVPFRKKYASTNSGMLLEIGLSISTCFVVQVPRTQYIQEISRNVNPVDWQL